MGEGGERTWRVWEVASRALPQSIRFANGDSESGTRSLRNFAITGKPWFLAANPLPIPPPLPLKHISFNPHRLDATRLLFPSQGRLTACAFYRVFNSFAIKLPVDLLLFLI
jgi:hypothetical protein